MRLEWFIARRMIGGRSQGITGHSSNALVRIAVAGIALGIAVMVLTVAIVTGFQNEIRSKVSGFAAHLQISLYSPDNLLDVKPLSRAQPFLEPLRLHPGVRSVNAYAMKSGIMAENGEIHGIVARGVDRTFDNSFFSNNMLSGSMFTPGDSVANDTIVLSSLILNRLNLHLGDKVLAVFFQDEKERKRRFIVGGVYETGMEQFDGSMVLCDMIHVQKLNNWTSDQVAGYEVRLNRFNDLELLNAISRDLIGWEFNTLKITDQFSEIFGWLELQDINVVIVIILMVLVCGINMISALLVLILERTNMIGLLKAMGATNGVISRVFLINAAWLIFSGMFWGNLIAIILSLLQKKFELLKLDKSSYYVDHVPVMLEWDAIIYINIATWLACIVMLLLPSLVVSRIQPVKTIRFN